jgi:hypothetical protein
MIWGQVLLPWDRKERCKELSVVVRVRWVGIEWDERVWAVEVCIWKVVGMVSAGRDCQVGRAGGGGM